MVLDRKLLAQKLDVLLGQRLADYKVKNFAKCVGSGCRWQLTTLVAEVAKRLQRFGEGGGLLLRGYSTLKIEGIVGVGMNVAIENSNIPVTWTNAAINAGTFVSSRAVSMTSSVWVIGSQPWC